VSIVVYEATCPICGRKIYGASEREAKQLLIEHMNRVHG
jgi:hypothetical protein